MRFFAKIFRVFAAILMGLLIILLLVQQDQKFKEFLEQKINTAFSRAFKCQFYAKIKALHLLSGQLELELLGATGIDNCDWSWQAEHATVTISWLNFAQQYIFNLTIVVYNLNLNSSIANNSLAILPHLIKLTTPPDIAIPLALKSFKINNGKCEVYDHVRDYTISFGIKNDSQVINKTLKSVTRIFDGRIMLKKRTLIDYCAGVITADKNQVHATLSVVIPDLGPDNQQCNVIADWEKNCGAVTVRSAREAFTSKILLENNILSADIATLFGTAQVTAQYNDAQLMGTLQATVRDIVQASGTWNFDGERAHLALDCVNNTTHKIVPKNIFLESEITAHSCSGTYAGQDFFGKFSGTLEHAVLTGTSGEKNFELVCALRPEIYLKSLKYSDNKILLLEASGKPDGTFAGTVQYPVLRTILSEYAPDMSGQGVLDVTGCIKNGLLQVHGAMHDAHIKLPYTYNLLQGLAVDVEADWASKKITVRDAHILLHSGEITSEQMCLAFDENFKLASAHVPLIVRNCFMSWQKDIFALISASLIMQYTAQEQAKIQGNIILDRSHVRSNLFSAEFGQDIFGMTVSPLSSYQADAVLDLTVTTRAPLQVKTPFLEAAARLNFNLKGTIAEPQLSGLIEIVNGSLAFPYQPLYITSGKIYFVPHQLDDPMIDLIAKNTIKKYTVGMSVTGSVRSPKITFESSPTLEEAQIITLLLGGSEDGSLYLAMPTTIMENIENLLFGPAATSSKMQKYLKNLFRPFKNIRIVPSFSDQTGRGGLRGSVAIEVNDRLRGVIEQNFSLTEDTRFEVDYALSDDTSIRAIKDERGDIGAELETRWKF